MPAPAHQSASTPRNAGCVSTAAGGGPLAVPGAHPFVGYIGPDGARLTGALANRWGCVLRIEAGRSAPGRLAAAAELVSAGDPPPAGSADAALLDALRRAERLFGTLTGDRGRWGGMLRADGVALRLDGEADGDGVQLRAVEMAAEGVS